MQEGMFLPLILYSNTGGKDPSNKSYQLGLEHAGRIQPPLTDSPTFLLVKLPSSFAWIIAIQVAHLESDHGTPLLRIPQRLPVCPRIKVKVFTMVYATPSISLS